MKRGILEAIADCRLRDALRMLEDCAYSKPVEVSHRLVLTAMIDTEGAYAHALEARVILHNFSDSEFVAKSTTTNREDA